MFGIGSIFSLFTQLPADYPTIDNIVLHQCKSPLTEEFGRSVMRVIWIYGTTRGRISNATNVVVVPYIHSRNKKSNSPTYVIEKGMVGRFTGLSLGLNTGDVLSEWRAAWPATRSRRGECDASRNATGLNTTAAPVNTTGLNIYVFQRVAGSALRNFVNIDAVEALVREFTDEYKVVTTSADMALEEQRGVFNSFDILITPHGSHLTNGVFIQSNATAIIEVQATCYNADFLTNLGVGGVTNYALSTGHRSKSEKNDKVSAKCNSERGQGDDQCKKTEYCNQDRLNKVVQDDVIVDIDILRRELLAMITILCPAP